MLKILKLTQSYLKRFSSWGIYVLEFEHQSFGSAGKALPLDKLALDSLMTHSRSLENRQMQMKTKISKTWVEVLSTEKLVSRGGPKFHLRLPMNLIDWL